MAKWLRSPAAMVCGMGGRAVSMTPHGCVITTMVRVRIVRAKIGHPSAMPGRPVTPCSVLGVSVCRYSASEACFISRALRGGSRLIRGARAFSAILGSPRTPDLQSNGRQAGQFLFALQHIPCAVWLQSRWPLPDHYHGGWIVAATVWGGS